MNVFRQNEVEDLLMFLYPGFSTLGEIDSVLFVGPIAPATYLFTPTNNYKAQNKVMSNCKLTVLPCPYLDRSLYSEGIKDQSSPTSSNSIVIFMI